MTQEEIIQAISDDKMMPFVQPEQLAQIVEFVINNYRPSLPSDLDEAAKENGKKEALKDLPMWKKATGKERFNKRVIVLVGDNDLLCTNYAEEGEYYLPFSDLEKLPKEDENHE